MTYVFQHRGCEVCGTAVTQKVPNGIFDCPKCRPSEPVANIDGEMVPVFGDPDKDPNVLVHIRIGETTFGSYAIHPALIPTIQAFLKSMSRPEKVGWIDGDGKWRGA